MRHIALALALVVSSSATAAEPASKPPVKAAAPAPKLDELLAQWKRSPGLYAKFRDEKHLAMLDAPLVSEGTIHFAPPQRLSRRTETPIASVLVIDGNKLSFGDAQGNVGESMDLGTNPVARLFVDSFVKLLEGDRAGLEKMFRVELAGRPGGGWKMTLVPRIAPMDKVIKEMVIVGTGTGTGTALSEMDIRETSGDWTHTVFTAVDVNRKYTAAEIERLFRPPGKR